VNSYWQLPARLFEDSEELAEWARAALAAAQRAALKKGAKARKVAKPAIKKAAAKKKKPSGVVPAKRRASRDP
jgi:DNA transformation protein